MISFAAFLIEAPDIRPHFVAGKHAGYTHSFAVGRHKVDVYYRGGNEGDRHHVYHPVAPSWRDRDTVHGPHQLVRGRQHTRYEVSFEVNGSYDRRGRKMSSMEKHKIAHHVYHSVRHFLHTVKPTHIRATGDTETKHKFYEKVWKHLAKHHPDYQVNLGENGLTRNSHMASSRRRDGSYSHTISLRPHESD